MDTKQKKIVGLVLSSYLVTAMNGAVIITSLPRMAAELQLDLSTLSWVQNVYVLAWGSLMLMGGRMSDVLGRQLMMIASLLLFGGGTLWACLSASAFSLIASRLVQGIGAAILAPTSLASTCRFVVQLYLRHRHVCRAYLGRDTYRKLLVAMGILLLFAPHRVDDVPQSFHTGQADPFQEISSKLGRERHFALSIRHLFFHLCH